MRPTESPVPRTEPQRPDLTPSRTFSRSDRARASLPSREQLLDLVEHAGRRSLTAGEVYLPRLGVVSLDAEAQRVGGVR